MSLLNAFQYIGGINDCVTLFSWARSAISSSRTQSNGIQEQIPQEDVVVPLQIDNGRQEQTLQDDDLLQLQSDLRGLEEKLPEVYDLINRAEWRSHKDSVAKLLPNLKDAVYDAEDLLDEFRWYDMRVRVEGEAIHLPPFVEFFHSIVHGTFNKVTDIQKRIGDLSSSLYRVGVGEVITPRFDKTLRPVTTSFSTEPKIFGRQKELIEVIRLLGVPNDSSSSSAKRKRTSNAANKKQVIASVPVLPIVGIGGVGKTTLAQEITTNPRVKSHFDKIIWICVSDEFDEERFTKILIKSLSGREPTDANLDDLQQHLVKTVGKKRFLLVLDDIWPAGLEDAQRWQKFCAPLKNVLQGSMVLVTTRFAEVANIVGTMASFAKGLEDDVFWEFFKLCVFGAEDSDIDRELEQIGRSILPKLKGTPLAAKTIGRLLRKSLDTTHWNGILNNELWQIDQKETDILPALRLSYMYLPFHLKRCFSFCAVYPKDYNFDKDSLAEIWVAEGFVEPQGGNPLQRIGYRYFEDLVNLSFFQEHRGHYVIHDLMHDMAQLVSKEECFILKNKSDIKNVPKNVRQLSILKSSIKSSDLKILCKYKKLRSLLCDKGLKSNTPNSMIEQWFSELRSLRVIRCASINKLPESIGNLKHLRYLQILRGGGTVYSVPSSFCTLYNLQTFYARQCEFGILPSGVSKLISLQKFESTILRMEIDASKWEGAIQFIENFNQIPRNLVIYNLGGINKDRAAEMELSKRSYLNTITLRWSSTRCSEHNEIEVFQALHPPVSVKSVHLIDYPGEHLPSWFGDSAGPKDMSFPDLSAATVDTSNGTVFSSLTEVNIKSCENLKSLELLLQSSYVPAIKDIEIEDCRSVRSVRVDRLGDSTSLEELKVHRCPNLTHLLASSIQKLNVGSCANLTHVSTSSIGKLKVNSCPNFTHLVAPSLKELDLHESCGSLGIDIDCSSLANMTLSWCHDMVSIELQKWSLPAVREIVIKFCQYLESVRESKQTSTDRSLGWARNGTGKFALLTRLSFEFCDKLETLDDLLTQEYLPAVKDIHFSWCNLLSLHTERFGDFHFLEKLSISCCPRLKWQSGIVLPCSLQYLKLHDCGDFSVLIPGCLEKLTSLEELDMRSCGGIVSVPGDLWSGLKSLRELSIVEFPDLVSIGGPTAIANINNVWINKCGKLKEIQQPF